MLIRLIERNLKLYLRDRMSVFFSFLSVLMVLVMYAVFLGENTLTNLQAQFGEVSHLDGLVLSWLMAGIVFISTVTVPINSLEIFVKDKTSSTIYDFYSAPVNRSLLILSYLIASVVITTIMTSMNFLVGQIYLVSQGVDWITFDSLMRVLGMIVLSSLLFSSLFFTMALWMSSTNAFGSLGTIVGTLVGFFAGIYVPIGVMSSSVQFGVNLLPFAHGVTLMRQAYMSQYLDLVFDRAPLSLVESYKNFYGLSISYFDVSISPWQSLLIMFGFIVSFFLISLLRIRRQTIS